VGYVGLYGSFMEADKIGRFSPKFERLLRLLQTVEGKSFVYINNVKTFGVKFVCQLMRANGIIGLQDAVKGDTLCFRCRRPYRQHNTSELFPNPQTFELPMMDDHKFVAYRFIDITGNNTNAENDKKLSAFNHETNAYGDHVQVVIGSKKIKQGFNIYATNNAIVLSIPYNVPNLIQVLGRNARTKSHQILEARY
jgi:hypothetical protein